MKKKKIANMIMAAVIAALVLGGILAVAWIQGWFDRAEESTAYLTNFRGIVTVERGGASFYGEDGTVLRPGDRLLCDELATVEIAVGESTLTLGQGSEITVDKATAEGFSIEVKRGQVFAYAQEPVRLTFGDRAVELENAVAGLSVQENSQSLSVYYGTAEEIPMGQKVCWNGDDRQVEPIQLEELDDFAIARIRQGNKTLNLCFTEEQLAQLELERWLATADPTEPPRTEPTEPTEPATEPTDPEPTVTEPEVEPTDPTEKPTQPSVEPTDPTTKPVKPSVEATDPTAKPTQPSVELTDPTVKPTKPTEPATVPTSKPATPTTPATEPTQPPAETEPKQTCTITIRCDTILDNWGSLEKGKESYVPESGCILPVVTVSFEEGETVFDVLKRVCETYNIQLEYSWTPLYNSYYIEGINHLYEFDCGFESGWMYKVNEWFPNYGCSAYTLKDGDEIVWCYTCVGLGADVGQVWTGE